VVRDRGCAFPGCTRPAEWCIAHYIVHWADGGPTTASTTSITKVRRHGDSPTLLGRRATFPSQCGTAVKSFNGTPDQLQLDSTIRKLAYGEST
jgi:hypothetical protein